MTAHLEGEDENEEDDSSDDSDLEKEVEMTDNERILFLEK